MKSNERKFLYVESISNEEFANITLNNFSYFLIFFLCCFFSCIFSYYLSIYPYRITLSHDLSRIENTYLLDRVYISLCRL